VLGIIQIIIISQLILFKKIDERLFIKVKYIFYQEKDLDFYISFSNIFPLCILDFRKEQLFSFLNTNCGLKILIKSIRTRVL